MNEGEDRFEEAADAVNIVRPKEEVVSQQARGQLPKHPERSTDKEVGVRLEEVAGDGYLERPVEEQGGVRNVPLVANESGDEECYSVRGGAAEGHGGERHGGVRGRGHGPATEGGGGEGGGTPAGRGGAGKGPQPARSIANESDVRGEKAAVCVESATLGEEVDRDGAPPLAVDECDSEVLQLLASVANSAVQGDDARLDEAVAEAPDRGPGGCPAVGSGFGEPSRMGEFRRLHPARAGAEEGGGLGPHAATAAAAAAAPAAAASQQGGRQGRRRGSGSGLGPAGVRVRAAGMFRRQVLCLLPQAPAALAFADKEWALHLLDQGSLHLRNLGLSRGCEELQEEIRLLVVRLAEALLRLA